MREPETVRIQFNFPAEKIEDLDMLMRDVGITSRRELFNNALTLLAWTTRQIREGRIIASIDKDTDKYRELHMPIFETIKKARKEENSAAAG